MDKKSDDLAPAKGIAIGVTLGIALWVLIAWAVWILIN